MNAPRARALERGRASGRRIGIAALVAAAWALASALTTGTAAAQLTPVSVGLIMESESVTIGETFTLTLSATYPPDHHVAFPQLPAAWGEFEVRGQAALPTTEQEDGKIKSSIEIRAVLFSPGEHPTPALSVAVRRPDGSVINRPVRPIDVSVESALSSSDRELREIKPQADVRVPSVWPYASGAAVSLLLAVLAAAYFWRNSLMPAALTVDGRPRSPADAAFDELERIERMDLPSKRRFSEHYTLISDCLRAYLSSQFDIPAQESTTARMVVALRGTPAAPSGVRDVERILTDSDLVKFARLSPDPDDARQAVDESRRVVRKMTPAEEPSTPESDSQRAVPRGEAGGED